MKSNIGFLIVMSLLFSCSNQNEFITLSSLSLKVCTLQNYYVNPFDTSIILKYLNNEENNEIINSYFNNRIIGLHKKYDRFNYYKNEISLKTINDYYGSDKEVFCDDELYNLIKYGYNLTLKTKGYFNFFIGNLTDYWNQRFDDYSLDPLINLDSENDLIKIVKTIPSLEEIKNIFTFNDEKKSIIFNSLNDIYFNGECLSRSKNDSKYRPILNAGGLGKGLLVDYLKNDLLDKCYGFINAGTSSISLFFNEDYLKKNKQEIYLTNPMIKDSFNREKLITVSLFDNYNISTSGVYSMNKFYQIDEKIRHHIINPYSGESSNFHMSISLFSKSLLNVELDAFTTSLMNLPLNECYQFINEIKEYNDLSYIIVDYFNDTLKVFIDPIIKDFIEINNKECDVIYE